MYNTGNPIGSTAPKDFSDNAEITDRYVNDVVNETTQDRFGRSRLTIHGLEQKAQLDIAEAVADATAEAGQYRDQALDAKNAAQEAAMMSGFSKYADTLAQLEAGIGTDYVEGDVVIVFQDESRGDTSSIFKIESGAAEFKLTFDKTRQDLLSFTGNISADAEWSDVPAHSDPAFDEQAQALADRDEYIRESLAGNEGGQFVNFSLAPTYHSVKRSITDKNLELISVKDFGAVGDGVADDTAAIKKTITYITSLKKIGNNGSIMGTGTFYVGTMPALWFPYGVYKITEDLTAETNNALTYLRVCGDSSVLVLAAGVTAFPGVGFNVEFSGLIFRGGARAFNVKTGNIDAVRIIAQDCEFHDQSVAHITSDSTSQSTVLLLNNNKYIQTRVNGQTFIFNSIDEVHVHGGWLTTSVSGKAVIVNKAVLLTMTNILGVPWGDFTNPAADSFAKTGRWVDNYGNFVATRVRFGGEGGGAPIIYNYTDSKLSTSWPYTNTRIILNDCVVSCNLLSTRADAGIVVVKSGLPAVVKITGSASKIDAPVFNDKMTTGTLTEYLESYGFNSSPEYPALDFEISANMFRGNALCNDASASKLLEAFTTISQPTYRGGLTRIHRIESLAVKGRNNTQTSTEAGTSIVDTGIKHNTPVVGYGVGAMYDVYVSGCPNSGGSSNYRHLQVGQIFVSSNIFSGSFKTAIAYTKTGESVSGGTGVGALNVTAVFWDGSSESQYVNANSGAEIRLKVSGYTGTIGASQEVRLIKRL